MNVGHTQSAKEMMPNYYIGDLAKPADDNKTFWVNFKSQGNIGVTMLVIVFLLAYGSSLLEALLWQL